MAFGYLFMFFYLSLCLSSYTSMSRLCVDSRVVLSLFGVLLVLLSIVMAGGILGILGFKMTPLVSEVIPFLILAVGVDHIVIIVDAYHLTKTDDNTPQTRILKALENVGSSIFFSSVSESLVFFIAAWMDLPATKTFCVYVALVVLINFLLQMTCFVALLTLDSKRQEVREKKIFFAFLESSYVTFFSLGISIRLLSLYSNRSFDDKSRARNSIRYMDQIQCIDFDESHDTSDDSKTK
jgi:Niemann-Pick C1 protein